MSGAYTEYKDNSAVLSLADVYEVDPLSKSDILLYDNRKQSISAETILPHLRRLNPAAGRQFQSKAEFPHQAPFRILTSGKKPRIPDLWLSGFVALSYCWRSDDWEPVYKDRSRPGHDPWPISSCFMRRILKETSENTGIWIDQMCIDQDDEDEKKLLLGSMDLIYSRARTTFIALEDVPLDTSEAELLVNQKIMDRYRQPSVVEARTMLSAGCKILSARWFSRAWCAHELQLSSGARFLVPLRNGESNGEVAILPLATIEYMREHLEHHMGILVAAQDLTLTELREKTHGTEEACAVLDRRIDRDEEPDASAKDYMATFNDIFNKSCRYESDKLTICLNASAIPLTYIGGYNPKEDYRWLAALIALVCGDAGALCGTDEVVTRSKTDSTPSWLRWNKVLESEGTVPLLDLSSIHSFRFDGLCLDLLSFRDVRYHSPSPKLLQDCTRFVERCSLGMGVEFLLPLGSEAQYYEAQDLKFHRIFFGQLLASSIDCGLDWMLFEAEALIMPFKYTKLVESLEVPGHNSVPGRPIDRAIHKTASDFCQAARNHIAPHLKSEDGSMLSTAAFLGVLRYILCLEEKFRGWDSEVDKKVASEPGGIIVKWADLGDGQKALTLSLGQDIECARGEDEFVVPSCLADTSCYGARRLWRLQHSDPYSPTIVSKVPLITAKRIIPNGTNIKQETHQTIVGHLSIDESYDII